MNYQDTIIQLKEDRKTEIIGKATKLFMECGIYEVSMGDIAAFCGVGVASLYRYFGNKNALVILCGEEIWDKFSSYFNSKYQHWNPAELDKNNYLKKVMYIFLDLYKELNQELCFVHNFDNYICKQKIPKEELVVYEHRVEQFYQFFSKAYQQTQTNHELTGPPLGEYQYLTINHVLFVMCQKFAQGELMSLDSSTRSDYELQVIIDLYQCN